MLLAQAHDHTTISTYISNPVSYTVYNGNLKGDR